MVKLFIYTRKLTYNNDGYGRRKNNIKYKNKLDYRIRIRNRNFLCECKFIISSNDFRGNGITG